jgi:hypothetical protein
MICLAKLLAVVLEKTGLPVEVSNAARYCNELLRERLGSHPLSEHGAGSSTAWRSTDKYEREARASGFEVTEDDEPEADS